MSDVRRKSSRLLLTWLCCALVASVIGPAHLRAQTTLPVEEESSPISFTGSDGQFDASSFLSSRTGFLPIAIPITEPAVGLGLALGITHFHDKPKVVPSQDASSRVIMPSTTVLFGAGTENGTWAMGLGHLGVWNDGRIRYLGAAGYASLYLDWYGKSDAFNGRSISYTNDVFFLYQKIMFQMGDSNFHIGPLYRLLSTDAEFGFSTFSSRIPDAELQSTTSGVGLELSYDSLDHPFSPTRGIRSGITYSRQAEWLGGDFNYGELATYGIIYVPFTDQLVLGVRADGRFNIGDSPFYDLPMLQMRGILVGRYVDNNAVLLEAELRWDITRRWTLVGFGGVGRVADSVDSLLDADNHASVGAGIRYLLAEQYGLRMGLDVAHGDDDWTVYVTVGTGWIRP